MPKVRSARRKPSQRPSQETNEATQTADSNRQPPSTPDDEDTPTALSRGQRKRQAKREKYLAKEKLVLASLKLAKEAEQAKQNNIGMDAIRDALLATVKEPSAVPAAKHLDSFRSSRSKRKLLQNEAAHMNLVLQHPAFMANPIDSIQQHLQNSIQQQPRTEDSNALPKSKPRKRTKSRCRATRSKRR